MAAGFRRESMYSKAGRKIKPTRRVKDIMCESMCRAFEDLCDDLREGEVMIRDQIATKQPNLVESGFKEWRASLAEVKDLLDEMDGILVESEYQKYVDHYKQIEPAVKGFQVSVCAYLATDGPSCDELLEGEGHIEVDTEELRTRIKALELELTQSQTQFKKSRARDAVRTNSTPKGAQMDCKFEDPQSTIAPTPRAPESDATAKVLEKLVGVLESRQTGNRLPRLEPDVFSGELLQFSSWWSAFETMIEANAKSEKEKLFFLTKYTSGAARDSIKGFVNLYHDEGAYARARAIILNRFGNRLRIADAYKAKLSSWNTIRSGDGLALQQYADYLWQCFAAMDTLDYLTNLSCQEENMKLAAKLPSEVAERWDRITDEAIYAEEPDQTTTATGLTGHFPSFHEFCKFVALEARIATGPRAMKSEAKETKKRVQQTTLATEAKTVESKSGKRRDEPKPRCSFCQHDHHLQKCREFLKQPAETKRNYAREKQLCFGCLKRSHVYRNCRVKDATLLADNDGKKATTMNSHTWRDDEHYAAIIPVQIMIDENAGHKILTYAMIDSQSDSCFVTSHVQSLLGAEGPEVTLNLTTMGRKHTIKTDAIEGLVIKGVNDSRHFALPRCFSKRSIPCNRNSIPDPIRLAYWPHMSEVLPHIEPPSDDIEVGLLLGYNFPEAFFKEDWIGEDHSKPFAMKTPIGWCVYGRIGGSSSHAISSICYKTSAKEVTMDSMKRAFDQGFELDKDADSTISCEDIRFLEIVKEGMTQLPEGNFQVPLPFRSEPKELPDSRNHAMKCLQSVKRKMVKQPEFGSQYRDFMNNMIAEGHAELVEDPYRAPRNRRWYWTHHGVTHPRKPGKVRGVMNGTTLVQGVSLNAMLLPGPDIVNSLVGVLTRFRAEKIAVTCDVRAMFYQVKVPPEQRSYLRFLWYRGGDVDGPIEDYQMTVHPFGATSSPGCANLALKEVAARFGEKYGRSAARFIDDHFYVDDGLGSVADDEQAEQLIMQSHGLCKEGGFWLHKYTCSSAAVMSRVPDELLATSVKNLTFDVDPLPTEKTLGVELSLERDCFIYNVAKVDKPETRRGCLSDLSGFYDPLGMVAPVLLPGRLILQALCLRKLDWDTEIEEEEKHRWRGWRDGLAELAELEIPRCVRRSVSLPIAKVELHTFSDASSYGYGGCCYLRLEDEEGRVDVSLLYSKSKVAPSKPITIPRMELQAAVLGVKMSLFMKQELRYDEIELHYWCDSKVALGYIKSEARRFQIYVANRAQFIRARTKQENWHYIATDHNPADVASRGAAPGELIKNNQWWTGPPELTTMATESPEIEVSSDDPELKREAYVKVCTIKEDGWIGRVLSRYSTWSQVVAVTSRVLIAVDKMRAAKASSEVEYRQKAERLLLHHAQHVEYNEVMESMRHMGMSPLTEKEAESRRRLLRKEAGLCKLDVYVDEDDVMRAGGRLKRMDMPREVRHPAVLPKRGALTRLLVEKFHRDAEHLGSMTTLNVVRNSGYWLVGGRATIRHYTGNCVICRRIKGEFAGQKMSDLPTERLEETAPFTHVAVDYFGPYYLKNGRGVKKMWCCVFVCMGSRAVHIEPAESLDTSSFLNAYRRFVGRRGPIRTLMCDQGTNFRGAQSELNAARREMDHAGIEENLKGRNVDYLQYRFNCPKASHMAGAWERMIRSIRSALAHVLLKHGEYLTREVFTTVIVEAECLVNSRPITVASDADDADPPALSPVQLLTMKTAVVAPLPGAFGPEDRYARRRWRFVQHILNQFWARWRIEYLQTLQSRQKWRQSKGRLKVGDVVLLKDDNVHRGSWPKGMVTEAILSKDERVRKVVVRTVAGEYQRPVNKLVLLYRPDDDKSD